MNKVEYIVATDTARHYFDGSEGAGEARELFAKLPVACALTRVNEFGVSVTLDRKGDASLTAH